MIHAINDKGNIVGLCPESSLGQIDLWKRDGYNIVEGPDIDIECFKYADNKLTEITPEMINADPILLARKKAEFINELKKEMRDKLSGVIGDYGDNIADVTRALVLSEYIRSGVADKAIIDGYRDYCQAMVEMYGGAEAILEVLNFDLQALQKYLAPYYPSKDTASKSTNVEAVTTEKKIGGV